MSKKVMKYIITIVCLAVPLVLTTLSGCTTTKISTYINTDSKRIVVGAEQPDLYLSTLKGKKTGLVVNQTSTVGNLHLVDFLLEQGVDIKFIFAPEHGFRGDHGAGARFDNNIDGKTGIPVISIYGNSRKPSPEIMEQLDIVIFDIQDVGVRFYTFISSMHYVMEAAADAGIRFLIFDRPNPLGMFLDGPMLEPEFASFVGLNQIPMVHGMTVGELAQMFKGEKWLKTNEDLDLTVIPVKNYYRQQHYSLPIKPSPNLPNDVAIALYPSLGFFEATPVSIGRGTDFPFQVIGHNSISIGEFKFTPESRQGAALKPKLMDIALTGQDLRGVIADGLDLSYLLAWYKAFKSKGEKFFSRTSFMDKLAGTDKLRKAILAGKSEAQIKRDWQQGLDQFAEQRKAYLLYPDTPTGNH